MVKGEPGNLMEGTTTSSWHYTSIRDQQPHHPQKQCKNAPKQEKGEIA